MDGLKNCPFCSAKMNLAYNGQIVGWHDALCFFNLLDEHDVDMTEEEIKCAFVKAWNRRTDNGT